MFVSLARLQKQPPFRRSVSRGKNELNTQSLCLKTLLRRLDARVEFYFSGLNLNRDKFMREKMSADPDGCMWSAASNHT